MIVGGYTLDLYCDGDQSTCERRLIARSASYHDIREGLCKKRARKDGWKFTPDGKVYCRGCAKKLSRKEPTT